MTYKKHFSVTLRVIFRIYIFVVLFKTLFSIFYQGLRNTEFESRHWCCRHCSRIYYYHRSYCRHCRFI